MTYDRYYYSILPQSDKQIYKAIYEGIQNFETSITVPKSSVSLQSIFQYVGLDNPHIFYVDFNQYTYFSSSSNAVIKPIYWYTKQDVADIVVNEIKPIQERYNYFLNSKELDEILDEGRDAACKVAYKKIMKVYQRIGLGRKTK